MIIAVDGPAGVGKSTISKIISKKIDITYIDTGAMYRAITYMVIENRINFSCVEEIKILIDNINIEFENDKLILNYEDVSNKIRSKEVNEKVSFISSIKEVREKLVYLQRQMSLEKSVLLDGRDIGTVVFPNADYKFYLIASVDVRANRRYNQEIEKGSKDIDFFKIKKSIENRDFMDSNRKISPLKKAQDAILINTDSLNISQVVEKIVSYIKY